MKSLFIFCFGATLLAQDAAPGWHRFGEGTTGTAAPTVASAPMPQSDQPVQQPMQQSGQPSYAVSQGPIDLTIAPGTWITARVNEPISTHYAQPGDAFMATLAEPIVVNGLVVARRGQTVQGRVAEVVKAGRVKGVSQLAIELTELSLVDGQQMPVKTQLVQRRGETSVGSDVGAIGVTTGVGAAVGAGVGGRFGAGMGAIAGAVLGTTGVLSTRGRDTILFPEQVLTFRLEQPVHVLSAAARAFQPGSAQEYDRSPRLSQGVRSGYSAYPPVAPYGYASPSYYGYGYPGYGYGFGYPYFGFSGGYFYGGRGYYGRGGYRR